MAERKQGAVWIEGLIHSYTTAININRRNNHRIIESFRLEGTPRGHLVQPPHSEQGHH